MQISDVKPEKNADIKARVLSMEPPRSVRSKRGGYLKVSEAMIGDSSGRIPLTLWQKQRFLVKVNNVIEIKDGWVSEYQGILRISLGRSGKLTIVEDPSFPSLHELLKDLRVEP